MLRVLPIVCALQRRSAAEARRARKSVRLQRHRWLEIGSRTLRTFRRPVFTGCVSAIEIIASMAQGFQVGYHFHSRRQAILSSPETNGEGKGFRIRFSLPLHRPFATCWADAVVDPVDEQAVAIATAKSDRFRFGLQVDEHQQIYSGLRQRALESLAKPQAILKLG